MKQLILVRHGVTDWNQQKRAQGQTDIPLNEEGRAQARALAERIGGWQIDALYASDLKRAAETARIVGAALGLEPVFDPGWREVNLGDLEGVFGRDIPKQFGSFLTWLADGNVSPGGESFADLEKRVLAAYERLRENHGGETVAVVSHGGVLRTLIARLIEVAHIDALSLRGNTSLSILDFPNGKPKLWLLNDTGHLT